MIKKLFLLTFAVVSLFSPFYNTALAQDATELQRQIEALKARIAALTPSSEFQFTRDLYFGMKNDADVKRLQEFLISKKYLALGSNTGNFFTLTRDALKRYQVSIGLPGSGFFGPLTRAKVNQLLILERSIIELSQKISVAESQSATPIPATNISPAPPTGLQLRGKPSYDINGIAHGVQDLINGIRVQNGLGTLTWDDTLAKVAYDHSADQAVDNILITNPDIICHYPMIRHEGIRGGYSLSDRLNAGGVSYRSAGENIVMFSSAKDFVFQYASNNPPPECPEVPKFTPGEGTQEERLALFQSILNLALDAVRGLTPVEWVSTNWRTQDEVVQKAVELWMNSDGHRANILRSSFNYGGVGIAPVNDYFIITHNFAGR